MTIRLSRDALRRGRLPSRGLALPMALLMLIVITIVSLSAVRFTSLELRMALNDEFRIDAFEQAQSLIDAVIANSANTPVDADNTVLCSGTEGSTTWTPGLTTQNLSTNPTGCTSGKNALDLPGEFSDLVDNPVGQQGYVKVIQLGGNRPPPRLSSREASSAIGLESSAFRIEASYDRSEDGRGRAEVHEGLMVLIPKT